MRLRTTSETTASVPLQLPVTKATEVKGQARERAKERSLAKGAKIPLLREIAARSATDDTLSVKGDARTKRPCALRSSKA